MSANDPDGARSRLRDFPAVFLSYDEPWADRNWLDLKAKLPRVTRVHGVKGLDACHKAAAAAVPGDWVVTVDADTRISRALADAPVPECFLTGNFRIDWLARNAANGLWSGNGCVKLWPKALINEMRTHEAAPAETLSLDHDVTAIRTGKSAQVTMPERAAMTDPAATAFHGFRAGLRETVFLRDLAESAAAKRGGQGWTSEAELARLIEIWCSVGRQSLNGRWVLYGARLGLLLRDLWPNWDIRQINDHDAIRSLWAASIQPRYQRGNARRPDEVCWNWQALESDLEDLGRQILSTGGPELAELDSAKSFGLAQSAVMASAVTPARIDSLGYRMLTTAKSEAEAAAAGEVLEQAAVQDHPAAHLNLGALHSRQGKPDIARAAWHFAVAARLGNQSARDRLETMARQGSATGFATVEVVTASELPLVKADASVSTLRARFRDVAGPLCIVLDKGVSLLPQADWHVPDPVLVAQVPVLGYLSLCPVTGLPRPYGVRIAAPARFAAEPTLQPDLVFPKVLGQLPTPVNAMEALRNGFRDSGRSIASVLATLGFDTPFGAYWIVGSLLARLGHSPSAAEFRRIAASAADGLLAEIEGLARELSRQTGEAVPVWSAKESRAIKRMIPNAPSRAVWLAAAKVASGHGPECLARSRILQSTVIAIWGRDPSRHQGRSDATSPDDRQEVPFANAPVEVSSNDTETDDPARVATDSYLRKTVWDSLIA